MRLSAAPIPQAAVLLPGTGSFILSDNMQCSGVDHIISTGNGNSIQQDAARTTSCGSGMPSRLAVREPRSNPAPLQMLRPQIRDDDHGEYAACRAHPRASAASLCGARSPSCLGVRAARSGTGAKRIERRPAVPELRPGDGKCGPGSHGGQRIARDHAPTRNKPGMVM